MGGLNQDDSVKSMAIRYLTDYLNDLTRQSNQEKYPVETLYHSVYLILEVLYGTRKLDFAILKEAIWLDNKELGYPVIKSLIEIGIVLTSENLDYIKRAGNNILELFEKTNPTVQSSVKEPLAMPSSLSIFTKLKIPEKSEFVLLKEEIEKILFEIVGFKCHLQDNCIISFSEKSSDKILKRLSDFLKKEGLSVTYSPSESLLGGLVVTSPTIEFKCELKSLLKKIQLAKEIIINDNEEGGLKY